MISKIEPSEETQDLSPIWSALRIINPNFAIFNSITFRAEGTFSTSASAWHQTIFKPVLLPILKAALHHARKGELRELTRFDQQLSIELNAPPRDGSLHAGRQLATFGCSLPGNRLLSRLGEWILTHQTPGHLLPLFVARGAAFCLTDQLIAGAYILQEIHSRSSVATISEVGNFIVACLKPLGEFDFKLHAA